MELVKRVPSYIGVLIYICIFLSSCSRDVPSDKEITTWFIKNYDTLHLIVEELGTTTNIRLITRFWWKEEDSIVAWHAKKPIGKEDQRAAQRVKDYLEDINMMNLFLGYNTSSTKQELLYVAIDYFNWQWVLRGSPKDIIYYPPEVEVARKIAIERMKDGNLRTLPYPGWYISDISR